MALIRNVAVLALLVLKLTWGVSKSTADVSRTNQNITLEGFRICIKQSADVVSDWLKKEEERCGSNLSIFENKGLSDFKRSKKNRPNLKDVRKEERRLCEVEFLLWDVQHYASVVGQLQKGNASADSSLGASISNILKNLQALKDVYRVDYEGRSCQRDGVRTLDQEDIINMQSSMTKQCELSLLALRDMKCALEDVRQFWESCSKKERRSKKKGKGEKKRRNKSKGGRRKNGKKGRKGKKGKGKGKGRRNERKGSNETQAKPSRVTRSARMESSTLTCSRKLQRKACKNFKTTRSLDYYL